MPNYPKEQLRELYKDLPKDLQKATFSEEVAANDLDSEGVMDVEGSLFIRTV